MKAKLVEITKRQPDKIILEIILQAGPLALTDWKNWKNTVSRTAAEQAIKRGLMTEGGKLKG